MVKELCVFSITGFEPVLSQKKQQIQPVITMSFLLKHPLCHCSKEVVGLIKIISYAMMRIISHLPCACLLAIVQAID